MESQHDNYPRILLSGTDPDLPDAPPVGFAKYNHFREMARGIKAVLYSCWDSIMGRSVAMKTLLPECANDKQERRRFLREARVTAQLQHPNTVPVYEIGRDDQERLYFTMKRIAGDNLFNVIKRLSQSDLPTRHQYPLTRQLEIIIQACQALAYAHAHGVVHRDVKPENIWVGKFGEVILLDWGVAKVWGLPDEAGHMATENAGDAVITWEVNPLAMSSEQDLERLTEAGQRPGTPLYMAPEIVLARYVDERADIFSMGVVLHEMLTFREPFRGRNVRETFDKILYATPPPVSESSPYEALPGLDALIETALAKNPQNRFQSMLEMLEALERCRNELLLRQRSDTV